MCRVAQGLGGFFASEILSLALNRVRMVTMTSVPVLALGLNA